MPSGGKMCFPITKSTHRSMYMQWDGWPNHMQLSCGLTLRPAVDSYHTIHSNIKEWFSRLLLWPVGLHMNLSVACTYTGGPRLKAHPTKRLPIWIIISIPYAYAWTKKLPFNWYGPMVNCLLIWDEEVCTESMFQWPCRYYFGPSKILHMHSMSWSDRACWPAWSAYQVRGNGKATEASCGEIQHLGPACRNA